MTMNTAAASKRALGNPTSSVLIILLGSLLSWRPAYGLEVPKGFVAFRGVKCDADYLSDALGGSRVEGAGVWKNETGVESAKECFDLCAQNKTCGTVTYVVGKQRCNMYRRCQPAEDEQHNDDIFWPYSDCPKSCRYFDKVGDKEKDKTEYITAARLGTPYSGKPFEKYWGTPVAFAKDFECRGGEIIKTISGISLKKCMRECDGKGSCKAVSITTGSNAAGDSHSRKHCTLWTDCTHFYKYQNTRSWVKGNSNS